MFRDIALQWRKLEIEKWVLEDGLDVAKLSCVADPCLAVQNAVRGLGGLGGAENDYPPIPEVASCSDPSPYGQSEIDES